MSNLALPTPRSRRRQRTKRLILDAARGRVAHGGIDALTLSSIAKALDLTAAALYRYFPNKGALLAAVNAEVLKEQRRVVHRVGLAARFEGEVDAIVALLAICEATILLAERQPDDFALLVATLADPRTLVDDPIHAVHMPELFGLQEEVVGWVARAQADGVLEPGVPIDRAMMLTFGTLGLLQTRKLARFRSELRPSELARAAARTLLLGWGATEAGIDARADQAVRVARVARLEEPE